MSETAEGLSLRQSRPRYGEKIIRSILALAAFVSIFTTFGIVVSLLIPSIEFFLEVPITDFLFGTVWTPLFKNGEFGVIPLLSGTIVITLIAIAVAIPLGLGASIYLSEYASDRVRKVLKPTLEVLAGIPTASAHSSDEYWALVPPINSNWFRIMVTGPIGSFSTPSGMA